MTSSMMRLSASDLSNTLFCVELLTRLSLSDKWKCYYISRSVNAEYIATGHILTSTDNSMSTDVYYSELEFRERLWSRHAWVRGDVSCALRIDGPVWFFCHEVRICGEYNLCRERAHHLDTYVKRIRVGSSEEDLDIEISIATAFREFDPTWSTRDCQIIFKVSPEWWSERLFESSVQIFEVSNNVLLQVNYKFPDRKSTDTVGIVGQDSGKVQTSVLRRINALSYINHTSWFDLDTRRLDEKQWVVLSMGYSEYYWKIFDLIRVIGCQKTIFPEDASFAEDTLK